MLQELKYLIYYIYIPIWSYFYPYCWQWKINIRLIYIPIWSYFYESNIIFSILSTSFTFQYGATSTSLDSYFPTCTLQFTFQYGATSTFIIRIKSNGIQKFTFQYGATSTNSQFGEKAENYVFTFQYGATSTSLLILAIKLLSIFTFQYGATSTLLLLTPLLYFQLHLHSNMELLLQDWTLSCIPIPFIYIPIWSYFYSKSNPTNFHHSLIYIPIWSYFYYQLEKLVSLLLPFTFQYGATSTVTLYTSLC